MSMDLDFLQPLLDADDAAFLEEMRNGNIFERPTWTGRAAAKIYLATRSGLLDAYKLLPEQLATSVQYSHKWPGKDYYKVMSLLENNGYEDLFELMPDVGTFNVTVSSTEEVLRRINYELQPKLYNFYAETEQGFGHMAFREFDNLTKVLLDLFDSGLAPTAMALSYDIIRIKYILKSKEMNSLLSFLDDSESTRIKLLTLDKLSPTYIECERELACTLDGVFQYGLYAVPGVYSKAEHYIEKLPEGHLSDLRQFITSSSSLW